MSFKINMLTLFLSFAFLLGFLYFFEKAYAPSDLKRTISSSAGEVGKYENLNAKEFGEKIDSLTHGVGDFVILDVRTKQEFDSGHIAGAMNLDFYKGQVFKNELAALDKNRTYFIYCRSGSRSAKTLNIMKELGFKKVYNLQGGIISWISAGYPILNSEDMRIDVQ